MKELGLPEDLHCVLLVDKWSMHHGAPIREFMEDEPPNIHLLYTPGGVHCFLNRCMFTPQYLAAMQSSCTDQIP